MKTGDIAVVKYNKFKNVLEYIYYKTKYRVNKGAKKLGKTSRS